MWPIRGSIAERRLSSRLMEPKTPRFCPEMKTRRGLGALDDVAQGVTVVGSAGQCLGVEHELAGRGTGVGGDDRDLDAELVGCAGLALADALDLGGVEGIELPAALALLLGADLGGPRERFLEGCFDRFLALDLAAD